MMTNAFPPKSGINGHSFPQNVAIRKTLDHKTCIELSFENCAQVHQHEEPRNSNEERIFGAIGLRPLNNAQGALEQAVLSMMWAPLEPHNHSQCSLPLLCHLHNLMDDFCLNLNSVTTQCGSQCSLFPTLSLTPTLKLSHHFS